jgi:hypothetical protein
MTKLIIEKTKQKPINDAASGYVFANQVSPKNTSKKLASAMEPANKRFRKSFIYHPKRLANQPAPTAAKNMPMPIKGSSWMLNIMTAPAIIIMNGRAAIWEFTWRD